MPAHLATSSAATMIPFTPATFPWSAASSTALTGTHSLVVFHPFSRDLETPTRLSSEERRGKSYACRSMRCGADARGRVLHRP